MYLWCLPVCRWFVHQLDVCDLVQLLLNHCSPFFYLNLVFANWKTDALLDHKVYL